MLQRRRSDTRYTKTWTDVIGEGIVQARGALRPAAPRTPRAPRARRAVLSHACAQVSHVALDVTKFSPSPSTRSMIITPNDCVS